LAAAQGTVPAVEAGEAPANMQGWNVYVGYSADRCELQNTEPIPAGENWVMAGPELAGGRKAGVGQSPAFYKAFERIWQRG
jgi:hypothetical protein